MLRIELNSEKFQTVLQNLKLHSFKQKTPVLADFRPQTAKKANIVIISNGIEQNQVKIKVRKSSFSPDDYSSDKSQAASFPHQKKHLIKKYLTFYQRQKKEDPDYSMKRQKNDRNVISNIIHHLMKHAFTFLNEQSLNYLFKKKNINLTFESFFNILNEKDKICKTYITNKHLKSLWNDSSEPNFSKAMRIISRIFLEKYSFLAIFCGNKLNKESKVIHYKGRRDLIEYLQRLK